MIQALLKTDEWFVTKLYILLPIYNIYNKYIYNTVESVCILHILLDSTYSYLVIVPIGIYAKVLETDMHAKIYTRMFIAFLFTIGETWKQRRYLSVGDGEINCGATR